MQVGDHVWADFGDGKVFAHIAVGAHENAAGETKYGIADPNGKVHDLGHREPADRDEQGSGLTFWKL